MKKLNSFAKKSLIIPMNDKSIGTWFLTPRSKEPILRLFIYWKSLEVIQTEIVLSLAAT